jgi:hypothetical protein
MGSPFSKKPKIDEDSGEVIPPSPFKSTTTFSNTPSSPSSPSNHNSNSNTVFSNTTAKSQGVTRQPETTTVQLNVPITKIAAANLSCSHPSTNTGTSTNTNKDQSPKENGDSDSIAHLPSLPLQMNTKGHTRTMVGAETQRKTTKLAKYCHIASTIEGAPHVFVSGIVPAESMDILQMHSITDIINCAPDVVTNPISDTSNSSNNSSSMNIHRWFLSDDKSERIDPFFFRAVDIIETVRRNNGSILVHCYQGQYHL